MNDSCHCLCQKRHPGRTGICDAHNVVTTVRYTSELLGAVDIPVCGPCAAAG